MSLNRIAIIIIIAPVVLYASNARAFECQTHIAKAEKAIATATKDLEALGREMAVLMDQEEMVLVHNLLVNAQIMLSVAKRNHGKPQSPYDHARAIAKADSARGYALATDILHRRYLEKLARR